MSTLILIPLSIAGCLVLLVLIFKCKIPKCLMYAPSYQSKILVCANFHGE